ncbi:hypothetical protein ABXK75_19345, partial [Yersinia enterocolitica]|uniref:hypothetical protein n=1 Tax=Yersinia enterocolitica TaxID=630 RepID=UPI00338E45BC
GRNRAHKETGYMAAIPERYFQEKTLGLLGASIYAARAIRDAYFYKGNTASLRSTCFHRCGHFVNNLIYLSYFKLHVRSLLSLPGPSMGLASARPLPAAFKSAPADLSPKSITYARSWGL